MLTLLIKTCPATSRSIVNTHKCYFTIRPYIQIFSQNLKGDKEIINRKLTLQKGDNVVVLKDLEKIVVGSYLLEINTVTDKMIKKIMRK